MKYQEGLLLYQQSLFVPIASLFEGGEQVIM